MSASRSGELVWVKSGDRLSMGVFVPGKTLAAWGRDLRSARVGNLNVPVYRAVPNGRVVYRHPVNIFRDGDDVSAGPVFAILAANGESSFLGSRSNFRDIIRIARQRKQFVYVLPTSSVSDAAQWTGYIRTGYRRWIPLPCPHPESVYNRIPSRNLERSAAAKSAKQWIESFEIPMFNPDYFNKAEIYEVIKEANLSHYLPETSREFNPGTLRRLLGRHAAVYLKPTGGSIGHGMMLVKREGQSYRLSILKNAACRTVHASSFPRMWADIGVSRVPGQYVFQAAVPLLTWNGRPCDFRVLLQKQQGAWQVVGKGVRVAGKGTITTHVPNGGYIANATQVLLAKFGAGHPRVDQDIDDMVTACADAIDRHYHFELGEMSMDVGVDRAGTPWFFEANAKPMKFDETDIRQRSLAGVVDYLEELRLYRRPTKMKKN